MPSVLQEINLSQAGSTATISVQFVSNVKTGSTIHVFAGCGGGSIATTFSDTVNTYNQLDTYDDTTHNYSLIHAAAYNVTGGTALTVTASFGTGFGTFPFIWIREIGGVNSSPLDGHTINQGSEGVTGTVSITPSNNNIPAFISSICVADGGGTIAATTGTQDSVMSGADTGTSSHQLAAGAGVQTVSFGLAGGSANSIPIACAAIFDYVKSGGSSNLLLLGV